MAQVLQLACPYCGTEAAPFVVHKWFVHPNGTIRIFLSCQICAEPVVAAYPGGAVHNWLEGVNQLFPAEVQALYIWPKASAPTAPNAVPTNVASLYVQAMTAFKRGHYDAAGPLFRRIMEVSVKTIHKEGKGSLFDRINNLPDDKGVTPTMKHWAHEVRIIGRDAAHDEDAITQEEATDMQAFVELFLVYAFDLPSRIKPLGALA